jgi:hypothetical protein
MVRRSLRCDIPADAAADFLTTRFKGRDSGTSGDAQAYQIGACALLRCDVLAGYRNGRRAYSKLPL